MWGVMAGLPQLFRGVGLMGDFSHGPECRVPPGCWVVSPSVFRCCGPRVSGLGRCLDPFIYFSSVIPRGKGHRHRLFILFGARGSGRRLAVAAGRAGQWGIRMGCPILSALSIISHLFRDPGVFELDFGLLRGSTSWKQA